MAGATRPKILVTRPQPGAAQTAQRLSNHNLETLILPFTEMVRLAHQLDDSVLGNVSAVLVTSANALRHTDDALLTKLQHLPIYTVGDATKEVALEKQFRTVESADGDARDLIKLVARRLEANASIVYLCGETRTDDVELQLGGRGFKVYVSETYRTKKVSQLTYEMCELIQHHSIDGILLYSSISARILSEHWSTGSVTNSLVIPMIFCISERTKLALRPDLRQDVIVCAQPRDDVMIETVRSYYQTKNRDF
ncbi:MAG: uroporphyrinogen-III synthase [Pseudomonadota bacterium]